MSAILNANLFKSLHLELKKLYKFYIAMLSLLLAGSLAGNNLEMLKFAVLGFAGLSGVFILYGMHGPMTDHRIFVQVRQFFNAKNKKFFLLLLIVTIPVTTRVLSGFSLFILIFTAFLGVLYSITFTRNEKAFKLKDFLFVKNSLIGFSWGALVLAGAGGHKSEYVVAVTILAMLQVFVGSMIRDLPDVKIDIKNGVNSFPVVLGNTKSIQFMHILNLSSFFILLVSAPTLNLIILISSVVVWRSINLIKINQNSSSVLWLQTLNLFTCGLIFLILLAQYAYGVV